jgi:hypothetical protein
MNRFVFCCLLLVARLSFGQGFGQFDSRVEKDPAELLAEFQQQYQSYSAALAKGLPERDLKVKTGEPVKIKFTRPDLKLLENKFVATFALRPAGVDMDNRQSFQAHMGRLGYLSSSPFVDRDGSSVRQPKGISFQKIFYPESSEGENLHIHFKWMAERCAPDLRPNDEQVAFLSSPECARTINRFGEAVGTGFGSVRAAVYQIHAPSAEEAEGRARAIIRLYDAGFSRPTQQYLLAELQKALEASRGELSKIAPVDVAIAAEKEKLSKPSEITSDILKELKAQKVMVAVELAGLSARVKACDAMLQDPNKLGAPALQSVGDMKVKAEIERVGIKEKLDAINGFIAEGNVRDEAQAKLTQLEAQRSGLQRRASSATRSVRPYVELLKLFEPFEIADNQITVAPLEWTE